MLSPRAPLIRAKRNGTPRTHAMLLEEHGRQNGCAFFSALRPLRVPRPPRPSLSFVRGPPVFRLRLRRGADLALGARFLAHRVACCGSSRACDKPPVPSALPPGVGRSRGLLGVGVLRWGAPRLAVSFMRAPDANLHAQILANTPTKLGGQQRAKRGAGGLSSQSAKPTR